MLTRYCIIRNQHIICDGKILFAAKDGNLNEFLLNAYASLKIEYPKFYKMDTLSKLGFLAAELLLKGREIAKEYAPESVALVLSNAHASLDTDLKYFQAAKSVPSPALFVYTLSNIVAGEICIRHKIKGENAFFVSEKFDPELLTDYVNMVLLHANRSNLHDSMHGQYRRSDACLCGWVDVLGEHHDVFLYLCEKNKPGSLAHTAGQVQELYKTSLWNN